MRRHARSSRLTARATVTKSTLLPGATLLAKDHASGQVGDATPPLAVNDVAQAPRAEPDRHERSDVVHQAPPADAMAPGEKRRGQEDAEEAAVKGPAALPHRENLER